MSFKIGDKKVVRNDLKLGKFGEEIIVEEMLEYKGKEAKIIDIGWFYSEGIFTIDLDNGVWRWTKEMFE